jgi:hypothetical protein
MLKLIPPITIQLFGCKEEKKMKFKVFAIAIFTILSFQGVEDALSRQVIRPADRLKTTGGQQRIVPCQKSIDDQLRPNLKKPGNAQKDRQRRKKIAVALVTGANYWSFLTS